MQLKASLKFNNKNQEFYSVLKNRVDGYFNSNQISKKGNLNMYAKTGFMFLMYFLAYTILVSGTFENKLIWLTVAVIMGFAKAGIGLCVMHDVNHGGFCENKFINKFLCYFSMHILGGHSLNWRIQHNNLHHNYTNVHNHDEDIAPPGILRFEPHATRKAAHRFQYLYAWFFYSIMTLSWCTIKDFRQIFHFNRTKRLSAKTSLKKELLVIIVSKSAYFGYMLLPFFLVENMSFLNWLCGFLIIHFIAGLGLATIFQAAHIVEETQFPLPDEENSINDHWAELQLKTTMNFSMESKSFSWLIGGLNFQVEHHLFPTICHVHYPAISGIVAQTAKEFNLPYYSQRTFAGAIRSHTKMLYRLGRD
jgi:linoleoyl-CoA desaturase